MGPGRGRWGRQEPDRVGKHIETKVVRMGSDGGQTLSWAGGSTGNYSIHPNRQHTSKITQITNISEVINHELVFHSRGVYHLHMFAFKGSSG